MKTCVGCSLTTNYGRSTFSYAGPHAFNSVSVSMTIFSENYYCCHKQVLQNKIQSIKTLVSIELAAMTLDS